MVKEGQLADPQQTKWLVEAIRKIKHQKQQPNIERISSAIKQHHKVSQQVLEEQLELSVRDGAILKVLNKGIWSYKDPARVVKLSTRKLKLDKRTDLSKYLIKTIRELGEIGGSTIKSIEKYICRSYSLSIKDDLDLGSVVRTSIKQAVIRGQLVQDGRMYSIRCESSSESDASDDNTPIQELADAIADANKNKVNGLKNNLYDSQLSFDCLVMMIQY